MLAHRKIIIVFGTRPEAIKMAPVIKEFLKYPQLSFKVVVTAQHREMLDQVLELFGIQPDYDLDLMQHGQTLTEMTSRIMTELEKVFIIEKPDLIMVQGDTTTTFAASLTAYYHKIPIGHVEAGLRTGNKYSPWPEEINRKLTGVISDLHFAPTRVAKENLLREGANPKHIYVTGNTVIDALLKTVQKDYVFRNQEINNIFNTHKNDKMIMMTTHRRENWGEPMTQICKALRDVVQEFPDAYIVFPVHRNPIVRKTVEELLGGMERVYLIEPLDYEPFVNLMAKSYIILTDSGGIQEEAPSLAKPVLVVRDTTERPEAVAAGTVALVGTRYRDIYEGIKKLLLQSEFYEEMARAANPFGDGNSSQQIAEIVVKLLNEWNS